MNGGAELVPLSDRLAALQGVRVLLAVVAVAALGAGVLGHTGPHLLPVSIAYVVVTTALEVVRRTSGRRALLLVWWMLLVDGVYLSFVIAETGTTGSRLLFLVYMHIVACTLLASFRSGMIVAVWDALLIASVAQLPGVVQRPPASMHELALTTASFVLVGAAGAAFASLNERALRTSRRAATALVDLGSALQTCRTVEDVSTVAASHLRERLGFRRAAVVVHDESGWTGAVDEGRGLALVTSSRSTEAAGETDTASHDPLLLAHVLASSTPLLDDVLPHACNLVVVPLMADGNRLGVAAVECGADRPMLAAHELELLGQSVARIALSAQTAKLLAEIERLATSDPLTGLANRRLFDDTLERELARCRRSGAQLALAMLDVDHFKLVNDRYGHQIGDEVLRQLAMGLPAAARRESLVARYGGEEFVVLLPDASSEDAVIAAERLRRAAADVVAVSVTVSVGVASLADLGPDGDLVAAADTALYQAKAEGRDRTVCFRPEPAGGLDVSITVPGS